MKKGFFVLLALILFSIAGCGEKKEAVNKPPADTINKNLSSGADNKTISGASDVITDDGKIRDIKYDVKEYLKTLLFDGKLVSGVQWKDKNGQNVIVLSETDVKEKKGKDEYESDKRSKQIYGYHFLIKDGKAEELWKVQDFIKDCEFDLTCEHIKNSLTITDLDSNGTGESTFLYRLTCRSDVSPSDMKLIMHEGKEKYAIRGEMEIVLENGESTGGKMTPDKSFSKAPASFLKYAKNQWEKFKTDKFD